jgi:polyamine oxidase
MENKKTGQTIIVVGAGASAI